MYTRLCAFLSKVSLVLAVIGLITIVVAVQYTVFGRTVLNSTPTWAEALSILIVIYVTGFGVAVGVRDAGHISLDSFLVLFPESWRMKFEVLIHILTAIFGGFMAHSGYKWTVLKWTDTRELLNISNGWYYIPLVISGVLIVMFSIEHIIALLKGEEVEPAWH